MAKAKKAKVTLESISASIETLMQQFDQGKLKNRLENIELKVFGSIQES